MFLWVTFLLSTQTVYNPAYQLASSKEKSSKKEKDHKKTKGSRGQRRHDGSDEEPNIVEKEMEPKCIQMLPNKTKPSLLTSDRLQQAFKYANVNQAAVT